MYISHLPFITLYVANMWAILAAGEVKASPRAHNNDPPMDTLRYENSFSNGPTNKPEKFIITSRVLIMIAAPVVPTSSSFRRSPNSSPNDGSIERVASWNINYFILIFYIYKVILENIKLKIYVEKCESDFTVGIIKIGIAFIWLHLT